MADDLKPLLLEMQKANALQTAMLKEKRSDDTAKQLFAGNMFEIFTQYDIFRRRNKQGMPVGDEVKDENDKDSLSNNISDGVASGLISGENQRGSLSHIAVILEQLFNTTVQYGNLSSRYQGMMLDLTDRGRIFVDKFAVGFNKTFDAVSAATTAIAQDVPEAFKEIIEDVNDKQTKMDFGNGPAHETTNKQPPSAAEATKKKEQTIAKKMTTSMTAKITAATLRIGKGIGEKIKKLTDGIIGKTGLVTLLLLGILSLARANSEFAKDMGALIISFGALGKGIGTFFSDPGKFFSEFGTFFTESFAAILTTAVFLFRKFIIKKLFGGFKKSFTDAYRAILKNIPDGLKKLMKAVGRFVAFPLAIVVSMYDFITTFARSVMKGQDFTSALLNSIYSVVEPIIELFKFVGKLLSIPMIIVGNIVKELFTNPIAFAKRLFSGDFSDLTYNLPELFPTSPSTSNLSTSADVDAITSPSTPNLSASAMGPTGGNTYNFNTVNAPTVASTNNHHHSNISITDSQQETTGLG